MEMEFFLPSIILQRWLLILLITFMFGIQEIY